MTSSAPSMRISSPLAWTLDHVVLGGSPYSLREHPFLEEILLAMELPEPLAAMKSRQCGASTLAVAAAMYHAEDRGRSVLYYLPQDTMVGPFVREKVDPIIHASPYLLSGLWEEVDLRHRVQNIHQKKLRAGWLYVRGAKSPTAREATPGDLCVLDERDLFEDRWIPSIRHRMNDSDFKGWWEISKPTLMGGAVHRAYEATDMALWMVRCNRCGKWGDLDWFRDVVMEEKPKVWRPIDPKWSQGLEPAIYCPHCKKARDRRAPGQWVKRHPGRPGRGFHISRLMTRRTTLAELWDIHRQAFEAGDESKILGFMNGDLGLPYTPASGGLSDDLLDAARRKYLMPEHLDPGDGLICTAGFDVQGDYLVGRVSRLKTMGGERIRQAVWIGRIDWGHLGELLARYPIRLMVIDGEFDPTKCKEFQAQHPEVWLASYPGQMRADAEWIQPDPHARWVTLNRTQSLDRSHGELLTGRNHLPHNARAIPEFYREMKAAVRVQEEDARGNKRFAWRKGADADDFRHADNYDFVAAELVERGFGGRASAIAGSRISSRDQAMAKLRREPSRPAGPGKERDPLKKRADRMRAVGMRTGRR